MVLGTCKHRGLLELRSQKANTGHRLDVSYHRVFAAKKDNDVSNLFSKLNSKHYPLTSDWSSNLFQPALVGWRGI